MIAFESLYLRDEAKMEMTYKLAHRASLVLGGNKEKDRQVFSKMKKAYSLRSDIVHGRKIKKIRIGGKEYSFAEFAQKIEDYLRESIKFFLKNRKVDWTELMFC